MFVRNALISGFLVFSMNTVAQAEAVNGGSLAATNQVIAAESTSKLIPKSISELRPELTPAEQLKRMRHASPLPNLMRIALRNKEVIKLDEAQIRNLEFWHGKQSIIAKRLVREITALEADVHASSLSGKPTGYLINEMSTLLGKRMQLASQKILCRDNMMHVLKPEQWKKVVELYKQDTQ